MATEGAPPELVRRELMKTARWRFVGYGMIVVLGIAFLYAAELWLRGGATTAWTLFLFAVLFTAATWFTVACEKAGKEARLMPVQDGTESS